ncbi:MAG: hypothetical protein ACYDD5_00075 [Sulfuricurvum sp.]
MENSLVRLEVDSIDDVDLKCRANELIEDIFAFRSKYCSDLSLIDTMIEYSFKYDIPLQELGNTIADHKEFVTILEKQLEREGYIKVSKINEEDLISDEEW